MKRPTALAAVFGLFLAGVISGLLGGHLFYARQLHKPTGPLWFMDHPPLHHLGDKLELTEQQKAQIDEILQESRHRGEEIRRQTRPQLHQLLEETHDRMQALLTPEQREKFEDLRFHLRLDHGPRRGHHRRHFRERRRHPHHRPGDDTEAPERDDS